jgi:hypothetical protein
LWLGKGWKNQQLGMIEKTAITYSEDFSSSEGLFLMYGASRSCFSSMT